MYAIEVHGITKSYGAVQALRGVSFDVQAGETFGLIGPDGAGKTTLFRILATLLRADGGTAALDGYDTSRDLREIRSRIGYMPGRFSLYQDLSVEENLRFFAIVFGTTIEANYHLIRDIYCQIEPFKRRRAGKLSGGMKQKLALCCALIHRPTVMLLDEPTTGVDPVSRRELWDMLGSLRRQGIAVLVSTPYMDEATRCDRIALIRDGALLDIDTPAGITQKFPNRLLAVRSAQMFRLLSDLRRHPAVASCFAFGDVHHVTVGEGREMEEGNLFAALTAYLTGLGHTGIEIQEISPTVEDCFMNYENAE